jgi:hypothetical protein
MKMRPMQGLGLLVAVALAVSAGPAFGVQRPQRNVSWTLGPTAPFGYSRFDGQYDAATGRIYFLGGRLADNSTSGEVWYYDVAAKTYTDAGVAMPVPVSNYGIAALTDANGLGFYIVGGRDNNGAIVTTVQVYYPGTNTAATVDSDPWPGKTPMNCVSLPAMGAISVGGKAYLLGGTSFAANGCADDNSAQTWRYSPMGTAGHRWKQMPSLNLARGYITPAAIGKKIYAIGGDINSGGSLFAQSTVEAWTPGDASWDDAGVADLLEGCDESQAFGFTKGGLANTITLAGCGQWPVANANVEQYDQAGNTWSAIGTLNVARRNHAGAVYGSGRKPRLFILDGYDMNGGGPLTSSEIGKAARASGPQGTVQTGSSTGKASTT